MNQKLENKRRLPELIFNNYKDTLDTVHLWTQIVGKIRLSFSPWVNHSWHVTLYVSPKGLTTGSIPYHNGVFQIDFDFANHKLEVISSDGSFAEINLYARTVADFYEVLFQKLGEMNIQTRIHNTPNEVDPAIPFNEDNIHKSYDPDQMFKIWQAWIFVHNVFSTFRADFIGKCSPVHFFWGAFDLAVTRFSGRTAPPHQGGAPNIPLEVMQEAYSHEVSSCGFWLGSNEFPSPNFYAYCYPTPPAYGKQKITPKEAFYSKEMGEYFLSYDVTRQSGDPEGTLLKFLHTTYNAAANTGSWDKGALASNFNYLKRFKQ